MSSKITAGYQSYGEDLMTIDTTVPIQALELDGTDDHVVIPDSASLDITNTLGLAAWVECGSQGTNDVIWGKYITSTNQRSFLVAIDQTDNRKVRYYRR